MTTVDVIDRGAFANLLAMTGDDEAFIDELVDVYGEDGEHQVASLRAAVVSDDTGTLVIAAHSLKTNSANMGALGVAELCGELEADGRAGSVVDARARVETIAARFKDARAALLALRGRG